ncbi:Ankyrin repeat domain-containing protein 33B, partial [Habropoda laboriosa]
ARRILEDSWQVKGSTCEQLSPVQVNNYSIVASRGELARNNCAARECIVKGKDVAGSGRTLRPIRKSLSVPNCFREGVSTAQKTGRRAAEESILKRSSAFLASLAHSTNRIREKRANDNDRTESGPSSLRRSPSVQTLPIERKQKSGARVKKSVSFSSDTSFEEKRAPYRKVAVHEVKVYRKGVLQDRSAREASIVGKVPSSWEATSEGRSALLRAARDADDGALNEIAAHFRKFGFGDVDVNMADSSGRTAVSYTAGNGASTMLEMALSFQGVDPNIPDNEGNTPLHFAAQAGQTDCLNVLLQNCPDIEVDARNASGFTPLMKAALQGRTKCAKILLFAGANPTLRDHGRGLRAEQWARFCGRYVCAEVIERFARHRLLERSTSCRWGSEPELAAKVLQGKLIPVPTTPLLPSSSGFKSKIRKVFRTTSGPDRTFSLVSQLTSAALCASSPALPKSTQVPPVVKSLLRPLSVPQLRVTLVSPQDFIEQSNDKYGSNFTEKIENTTTKPSRSKKKNK